MMTRRTFICGTMAAPAVVAGAFAPRSLSDLAAEYCDLMTGAGVRLFVSTDGATRWEDYSVAGGRPHSPRLYSLLESLCSDAGCDAIAGECRRRGWVLPCPSCTATD